MAGTADDGQHHRGACDSRSGWGARVGGTIL
jgi:hypothetical protein